jgi:hypothetical protein
MQAGGTILSGLYQGLKNRTPPGAPDTGGSGTGSMSGGQFSFGTDKIFGGK